MRFALLRRLLNRGSAWPTLLPALGAQEILNSAQAHYAPKPIASSQVILARATVGNGTDTPYVNIYADQALGWTKIISNLNIVDVEGGHSSMLQEAFVDSLAHEISQFIETSEVAPAKRHKASVG
jgi:thioesterase domain-containing protein